MVRGAHRSAGPDVVLGGHQVADLGQPGRAPRTGLRAARSSGDSHTAPASGLGGLLDVVDPPDPVPGDGDPLYDVSAAGINFADTHHRES